MTYRWNDLKMASNERYVNVEYLNKVAQTIATDFSYN